MCKKNTWSTFKLLHFSPSPDGFQRSKQNLTCNSIRRLLTLKTKRQMNVGSRQDNNYCCIQQSCLYPSRSLPMQVPTMHSFDNLSGCTCDSSISIQTFFSSRKLWQKILHIVRYSQGFAQKEASKRGDQIHAKKKPGDTSETQSCSVDNTVSCSNIN